MSIYAMLLIIVLCTAGLASYVYHKAADELLHVFTDDFDDEKQIIKKEIDNMKIIGFDLAKGKDCSVMVYVNRKGKVIRFELLN